MLGSAAGICGLGRDKASGFSITRLCTSVKRLQVHCQQAPQRPVQRPDLHSFSGERAFPRYSVDNVSTRRHGVHRFSRDQALGETTLKLCSLD